MVINTYALTAQSGDTNVFSQAGIVSLMGMVTIFVVLALLWVAVEIMHRVLHRDENEKKSPVASGSALPNPTMPLLPQPLPRHLLQPRTTEPLLRLLRQRSPLQERKQAKQRLSAWYPSSAQSASADTADKSSHQIVNNYKQT